LRVVAPGAVLALPLEEGGREEAVLVLEVGALAALVQGHEEEDVAGADDEAGVPDGDGEGEAEEDRDLLAGVPASELEAGLGSVRGT
jgi:hypothetical protein